MIIDIMINGLLCGGIYSILTVGFALIFGVAKMLNMAHTAFYMATAFFIFIGILLSMPTILSFVISLIITTLLGVLIFIFLLDRIKEHANVVMIITVALAILFQEIFLLAFGGTAQCISPFIPGFILIGSTKISYQHLFAIGLSALVLVGLWLLLSKTRLGNAIRAVAEDKEIANLMGINVSRISTIVMGLSAALGGLAGAVVAPIYTIHPYMWVQPLIIILAAAVLGGLSNVGGCIIGALILGYTETIVTFVIPSGAFLRGAVSLSIMVLVLLFKPEGLFGVVFEEERL